MRSASSIYHHRVLSWGPPSCVSPFSVLRCWHTCYTCDDVLVLTLNIPWLWPHAPAWYIVSSTARSSPDVVRPLSSPHHVIRLVSRVSAGQCRLCPRWPGGWSGKSRVSSDIVTSCVIWPVFASRYYSINSAGASTLTFNATSIQNGVLLGFLLLVLGVLILPLFGVNLLASDEVSQEESVISSDN